MVNEERLRQMIKMAKFDTNDGKQCKPMIQYARKDYVSLQLLKSFVTGTVCYMLLALGWGLYSMESLMDSLVSMDLASLITTAALLYVIFLTVYLAATYIVFQIKYTQGRKKVKKYYASLKKVNRLYERDDHLRTQTDTDWE